MVSLVDLVFGPLRTGGDMLRVPQDVTHERQPREQSVSESNFRAQRMKLLTVDAAIVETLSQNTRRILWCGAMKQKDFVRKP